jgi:hypothetical protein
MVSVGNALIVTRCTNLKNCANWLYTITSANLLAYVGEFIFGIPLAMTQKLNQMLLLLIQKAAVESSVGYSGVVRNGSNIYVSGTTF